MIEGRSNGAGRELVAVIPQKRLDRAKTRLAGVLDDQARQELTLKLLRRTLEVCRAVEQLARLLISGPEELRGLANEYGAELLVGGCEGMRKDITQCATECGVFGQAAMLVVSSDLPLMRPEDLRSVIQAWQEGAQVVLVPDRRERGTNVMLVDAPERFEYCFGDVMGPGSFHDHRSTAVGLGLRVAIIENPRMALDLDLPADVVAFIHEAPGDELASYLEERTRALYDFE